MAKKEEIQIVDPGKIRFPKTPTFSETGLKTRGKTFTLSGILWEDRAHLSLNSKYTIYEHLRSCGMGDSEAREEIERIEEVLYKKLSRIASNESASK